ncbi:hypothetical protein AAF712_012262, partial [Marasmius tenuissimus]
IMTGEPPFPNVKDVVVISLVSTGIRPGRPSKGWCPDNIWELVEGCWSQDPLQRPRAEELQDCLQKLMEAGDTSSVDPPSMGHFYPDSLNPPPPAPLTSLSPGDARRNLPKKEATGSTLHISGSSVRPSIRAGSASPQRHSPPASSRSDSNRQQHSNNTSRSSNPPAGLPLWRGQGRVLMSGDNSRSLRSRAMDAINHGYRTVPGLLSRLPPEDQGVISIIVLLAVGTSSTEMMVKVLVSIVTLGLCWEHVVFLARTVFRKTTSWIEDKVRQIRDLEKQYTQGQGYALINRRAPRPRR